MRRSTLVAVGCALSLYLIGAASAWADNGPHVKLSGVTPDRCAACHRAHTAQAPFLLKEDQDALCYTCHGSAAGGSSLDVKDGVGYTNSAHGAESGALRGGGFEYALISSDKVTAEYAATSPYRLNKAEIPTLFDEGKPGESKTSRHDVGLAGSTIWGNGALESGPGKTGVTLECASCHNPHGNGNYRILKGTPSDSGASTAVSIPDVQPTETKEYPVGSGTFETKTNQYVYTTSNYWKSWDVNDRSYRWMVSAWCTTCHKRYLAPSGSYNTASGDAIFKYEHRTEESKGDFEGVEGSDTTKTYAEIAATTKTKPNCIQCHVSHGSNAKMGEWSQGVVWPGSETARGTDSSLLRLDNRGVCQTCHKNAIVE